MSWINELLLPVFVFWPVYIGVGAVLERVVIRKHSLKDSISFLFCMRFLLGVGITTLFQFILSLFHVPLLFSFSFAMVISIYGLFVCLQDYKKLWKKQRSFSIPTMFYGICLGSILFLLFLRSFSSTAYTWDAVAFWMPKTYALWHDTIIKKTTFEFFNHPEYPLLLPIVGANTFTIYGYPNEVAVKVTLFGFSLALIGILDYFLSKTTTLPRRFFFMFLFLSSLIVREHLGGEYVWTADILVGTYIGAGTALMLINQPLQALLLWSFTPWAKTEGLIWAGITLVLTYSIFHKHFKKKIQFIAPMFIMLSWFMYIKIHGMTSQYFKFNEIYVRPWLEYFIYSIHAFREEFRNLTKWNLLFFFFFTAILLHSKKIMQDKKILVPFLAILGQLVMYVVIFTITPEEQATFIASSVSRLTLHIAPSALLITSYLFSDKGVKIDG